MPRIDRNRSLVIPYRPNPPPVPSSETPELVRATWEELTRIAASLSDIDRPVSVAVSGVDSVAVGATATYSRLFDSAPSVEFEKPGGAFNAVSGVWTCPQDGLYQVTVNAELSPLSAPAQKSYVGLIRRTLTHAAGGADSVVIYSGGGLDDQFLSVIGTRLLVLQQGDTLRYDGAATHPTKTGTVTFTSVFYATRLAGVGNAD